MRFSEASNVIMSLCLTGVDVASSSPSARAMATTDVTRRLTGTAYGPIRENAGADEIVCNALQNRCNVIARSGIRVCTICQPARAVTAFAGTWRGPWMGWSLPCAGSSAPAWASACDSSVSA